MILNALTVNIYILDCPLKISVYYFFHKKFMIQDTKVIVIVLHSVVTSLINCFGPLKLQIKGIRYGTMEELKNAINGAIIVGNENGTFNGVTKLPEVWESIVNKGGDYGM